MEVPLIHFDASLLHSQLAVIANELSGIDQQCSKVTDEVEGSSQYSAAASLEAKSRIARLQPLLMNWVARASSFARSQLCSVVPAVRP